MDNIVEVYLFICTNSLHLVQFLVFRNLDCMFFMLRQSEHLHLAFQHRLRNLNIPCAILTFLAKSFTSLAKPLATLAKARLSSLAKVEILLKAAICQKVLESSMYLRHTRLYEFN